eukprot:gene14081-biopygen3830
MLGKVSAAELAQCELNRSKLSRVSSTVSSTEQAQQSKLSKLNRQTQQSQLNNKLSKLNRQSKLSKQSKRTSNAVTPRCLGMGKDSAAEREREVGRQDVSAMCACANDKLSFFPTIFHSFLPRMTFCLSYS